MYTRYIVQMLRRSIEDREYLAETDKYSFYEHDGEVRTHWISDNEDEGIDIFMDIHDDIRMAVDNEYFTLELEMEET